MFFFFFFFFYNTTNFTLHILITIQYFLRNSSYPTFTVCLFVVVFFWNYTPMYLTSYIMVNRFPLSLKHLTIIVLGSDMAFNFVFSLN